MTRPMSEEREKLAEQLRFIAPDNNTVCWYGGPTQAATIIRQAADALLSTSSAERGMTEALEKAERSLVTACRAALADSDFDAQEIADMVNANPTIVAVRAALSSKGEG